MGLDLRGGAQIMAAIGNQHLQNIFVRDPEQGARLLIITGEQGSGKTTLMLIFAKKMMETDYVVWRGRDLAQWHRFPDYWRNVVIFAHENDDLTFLKIPHNGGEPEELDDVRIIKYSDPRDIIPRLRKTKINVVYEPSFYSISDELAYDILARSNIAISPKRRKAMKASFFWFEFFFRLLQRPDRRWISVFLDEVDDIMPETPKGLQWVLQEWMKDTIKDLRKAFINFIGSAHILTNVDWRIRSKIQIRIYLKGAQIEKNSLLKGSKASFVHKLQPGTALIEWGTYGVFTFKPLPHPGFDVLAQKKWNGPMPEITEDDVPDRK